MTHTREIFRHGRYVQCRVLNSWTSSQDCPKYLVCNDLVRGDVFLAKRGMGTWCEVDLQLLAHELNAASQAQPAASPTQGEGE